MLSLSLSQALAALPEDPVAIAARLGAQGCRGIRENNECCPIANYLTGLGFVGAWVDPEQIAVDDEDYPVDTPPAVGEFVNRFDKGDWPELVSDPEEESRA